MSTVRPRGRASRLPVSTLVAVTVAFATTRGAAFSLVIWLVVAVCKSTTTAGSRV
jgi:shikimate kinase